MTTTATGPSMFRSAAEYLDPIEDPYVIDPVGWTKEKLRENTYSIERLIMESVRDNRYTAVPSSHDTGKSWTASRIVAWWIDSHPPGEAFAVTTAPTDNQVKAILWREIGRAHRFGRLGGRVTLDAKWKLSFGLGPDELVAYGRKPADYEPTAFSGIHSRFVLVVIDEAGGVSKPIFEAVDTLATNENARVLAIGNPDDPSTEFSRICKPGSGWHVIHIDGLRTPNFTREEVAKYPELQQYMIREGIPPSTEKVPADLRPFLLSPLWVAERIKRWGINSPMFTSKVRGRFPHIGQNTLIEPRWVIAAQNREAYKDITDPRMACDVARFGKDHSIIGIRWGVQFRIIDDIPYGPTTEVAGKIIQYGTSLPLVPIVNVDDTGIGGGVTDILKEKEYPVVPLISNARCLQNLPNGKPKFDRARSEWWWNLREVLAGPSGTGDDSVLDLDPDDEELLAQLTNIRYKINSHGQICVETKDEMEKRGVASPDRGDTLAYCLVTHVDTGVVMERAMLTADLDTREW